jgi:hypothetical protein
MDSDAFYKAIELRPSGMIIPEAVTTFSKSYQCSVDSNCCESIRKGITRFHSHINRIRNELRVEAAWLGVGVGELCVEAETVVVKSKPVEPVVTPEVVIPTPSMKVGDNAIVHMSQRSDKSNTYYGLVNRIVKIIAIEGDQACVKNINGRMSVLNMEDISLIVPKEGI